MKNSKIADNHCVARHMNSEMVPNNEVIAAAFDIRIEKGETGISVNWLEFYLPEGKERQLIETILVMQKNLTLRKSHYLVELNVGQMKKYVFTELERDGYIDEFSDFDIVRKPLEKTEYQEANPAHSEITGIPLDDLGMIKYIGGILADYVNDNKGSLHLLEKYEEHLVK